MILNRIIILFLMFLSLGAVAAERGTPMAEAGRAYQENRLEDAGKIYRQIVDAGGATGDVYYNLGNVAYRLGNLGEALQYYEKAIRLDPRDPDIRANLHFVRQKLAYGGANDRSGFSDLIFSLNSYVTLNEEVLILCLVAGLSFLTALLYLFFRQDVFKWGSVVFFALFFFVIFSFGIKYRDEAFLQKGVVTSPRAGLYPTFLEEEGAGVSLPEGTEVQVVTNQETGGVTWVQVVTAEGRKGWMKSAEVGKI